MLSCDPEDDPTLRPKMFWPQLGCWDQSHIFIFSHSDALMHISFKYREDFLEENPPIRYHSRQGRRRTPDVHLSREPCLHETRYYAPSEFPKLRPRCMCTKHLYQDMPVCPLNPRLMCRWAKSAAEHEDSASPYGMSGLWAPSLQYML